MLHSYPSADQRLWPIGLLLVLALAVQPGCDDRSSSGRTSPQPSPRTAAPSSSVRPGVTDGGDSARADRSSTPEPPATATSSASAAAPPSPPRQSVRCSAAQHDGPMFLGRLMGFKGSIAAVDGLGMLVRGTTSDDKDQLSRIPKNPATEPKLKEEPARQILVDDAAMMLVNDQSIYYLEPQQRFPFKSRLLYLPTSIADAEPKVLAEQATHIVEEWDGWLYFLRLRDDFNDKDLNPVERAAVLSERYQLNRGYRWRFRYDLLRVKKDGTTETIGESPRDVDAYHGGHVYGRIHDWGARKLGVYRASVAGGKQQVLYERPWGVGRGGVPDHIGEVVVDKDGVFFYDARYGVVRRLDHDGGASEEVVRRLAFGITLEAMGDYLFIDRRPRLKQGGTITYRNDSDSLFGEDQSGCGEIWSSLRKGPFQFVAGRRALEDQWYGDLWGFVYEYLPGGVVNARRFKLKPGHTLIGPGVDDECLYYTRTDYYNTWFYGMPRPAAR